MDLPRTFLYVELYTGYRIYDEPTTKNEFSSPKAL